MYESKGINVLEETVLHKLLGADGVEKLRDEIISVIVEEVREQLHESGNYIISPDDVSSDIYDDVINEVKREITSEYKEKIKEAVEKKLSGVLA